MVVVVTGSAGFLGRFAVKALEERGATVVPAGRPALELPSPAFDRLLSETKPVLVVHCAGPASVPASLEDPERDREGSVGVTRSLVRSLERLDPPPRLVLVSSAAVYGEPASLPVAETDPPAPISPYGRHRLEAEQIALESSLATVVLRVFSAYGNGLKRQLLWDIATKARRSAVVELWGTGDETRDFVHASDVASAIARVGLDETGGERILNVGSGEETSVRAVATSLLAELGARTELRFRGVERAGDPLRWVADVGRLRSLGWTPSVPLAEGLAAYARWLRSEAS